MNKLEKIFDMIEPVTESGCFIWTGPINDKGYGRYCMGNKRFRAHRLFWEHAFGPIPQGLVIDHLCRVRCCVNVKHMELVPMRINTIRGISPPAVNILKTHCKNGHALIGDNLLKIKSEPRERRCRACAAAYQRSRYVRASLKGR